MLYCESHRIQCSSFHIDNALVLQQLLVYRFHLSSIDRSYRISSTHRNTVRSFVPSIDVLFYENNDRAAAKSVPVVTTTDVFIPPPSSSKFVL
mmetsp:Transcript_57047/g.138979  ORF Transcript_57047/g.138979 Transcript_57047/m.138979 type:complete len:93 (+) Transcript_57047:108-386(+)